MGPCIKPTLALKNYEMHVCTIISFTLVKHKLWHFRKAFFFGYLRSMLGAKTTAVRWDQERQPISQLRGK